jgi:outer membrane protein OmpA-like peptidoglycan-associated protein
MRLLFISIFMIVLSACSALENDVQRGFERSGDWKTPVTYTAADIRIVTERDHPVLNNRVVCTEPSPDVAKALSTASQLSAQGGNGVASAGVTASGGSAEAISELAGRSTAIMGIRDALYRACEAYANGAIGADAYALILSRYGQVMTTLFLAQDMAGATAGAAKASTNSPSVPAAPTASNGTTTATMTVMSANPSTSSTPSTTAPAATPGAGTPSSTADKGTDKGSASQTTTTSSIGPAAALVRMNEDYFRLDYDLLHLLVVACVNDNDPTRLHSRLPEDATTADVKGHALENPWLKPICADLVSDPKVVAATDKAGNPIKDKDGNPIMVLAVDKNGNPLTIVGRIAAMDQLAFQAEMTSAPPVKLDTSVAENKPAAAPEATKTPATPSCLALPSGMTWTVKFDTGSTLDATAKAVVDEAAQTIAAALKTDTSAKVTVAGYTDASGTASQNSVMAVARVKAVTDPLVASGVAASSINKGVDGSASSCPKTKEAVIVLTPTPKK